ncbi:MAG: ABC transporter permease [Magnetococcales bacterium]|nr:ABC transporter permease [Magnetococcales bacterium]
MNSKRPTSPRHRSRTNRSSVRREAAAQRRPDAAAARRSRSGAKPRGQEAAAIGSGFHTRSLRRAWNQFQDGSLSHWITTLVIALSLTIYGVFALLLSNASSTLSNWQGDNVVTLFLEMNTPQDRIQLIHNTLKQKSDILDAIRVVSPEKAFDRLKEMMGTEAGLLKELDSNPLPFSIEFHLIEKRFESAQLEQDHRQRIRKFAEDVATWPGVESVSYDYQWADRLAAVIRVFRYVGGVLSILLLAAVALIISNTIKLTIIARRDEVEVMRFMGATDAFIKTPFIYEGVLQGLLGALFALAMITILYTGAREAAYELGIAFGAVIELHHLPLWHLGAIVGVGVSLGLVGAMISVSRFLKV